MALAQGPTPFDLNLPPYPAFCNPDPMLDPGSTVATPGEYTVECSMPVLPQLMVGYGANSPRTAKLLDAVWDATTSEVYVNGEPVDRSAFGALDADVPVTGMPGQDAGEVVNEVAHLECTPGAADRWPAGAPRGLAHRPGRIRWQSHLAGR